MLEGRNVTNVESSPSVRLRCPHCRHQGSFESVMGRDAGPTDSQETVGVRRCPNPDCLRLVFVVFDRSSLKVEASFPPERLEFDPSGIPKPVVEALEEAVTCHAHQCYKASAMMVRKTLEEMCEDRGAKGDNLAERIQALGTTVVLPAELLTAADEIRLLGNDAAHVESKDYNDVGQAEVEVAIDFAKELLKAVYQYTSLLSRMQALKKPSP